MVDYRRFYTNITALDDATCVTAERETAVSVAVESERTRFTRLLSGIATDELQTTGAVHERTVQLDEELKRCRAALDACSERMVADGKSLMQQMAEFRFDEAKRTHCPTLC